MGLWASTFAISAPTANDSENHCAHFVSHVLNLSLGATCLTMTGKGASGASIRVHELFRNCGMVGSWDNFPTPLIKCLAFVTDKSNVDLAKKTMQNVPKKHVGIYYFGTIYQYKNAFHQVISQTPEEFSHHYSGDDIKLFFGTIP
jgi:hypothetical protein